MAAREAFDPLHAAEPSACPDMPVSRSAARDHSPPRTPKGKAPMRALDTHFLPHDTFFDDDTPVDKRRSGGTELSRDSHDLNFKDVTRESVVDNMLLSLDSLPTQFGSGLYNSYDDDDFYQATAARFSPPQILRNPGQPYPSEYDGHPDDSSSRYSGHHTRGRRSNSTTNFRSDLDRIDSIRLGGYGSTRMSSDTQRRAMFGEESYPRAGVRKGSKGSQASSVDLGYGSQIVPGSRRVHRASSFDHGYGQTSPRDEAALQPGFDPVLDRGRPNILSYSSYDAAPTPTIPTGSRRHQDPPSSPPLGFDYSHPHPAFASLPVHVPAVPAPSSRRNSLRSASSKGPWNAKARGPDASIRAQASDFVNAVNIRELPPIPAFADTAETNKAPAPQPNAPKERRGFFSRVFGGGKTQQAAQEAPRLPPQLSPLEVLPPEQAIRPQTHNGSSQLAPQVPPKDPKRAVSAQQVQQVQQPQPQKEPVKEERPVPTLTKKNSSFFRRRKKSVNEQPPPPPMPAQVHPRTVELGGSVLPSPTASSLRQVMNPFLSDFPSASPAETTYYDSREHPSPVVDDGNDHAGGFSPNYTPHKDATIRPVEPGAHGTEENMPPAFDDVRNLHSRSQDSPKYKLKMKRGKGGATKTNDDSSFLADSSDNEDMNGGMVTAERSSTMRVPETSRRPATSPNSPSFVHHNAPSMMESTSGRQKANIGEKRSEPHAEGVDADDDSWIITTPTKKDGPGYDVNGRNNRVWLEPTSSEEKLDEPSSLSLPLEGAKSSAKSLASPVDLSSPVTPSDAYQSASSLPIVQLDGGDVKDDADASRMSAPLSSIDEEPTDDDREKARQVYEGNESLITKARAAAWLGEKTPVGSRCRKAYMELYEWTGFSILLAMRDLCNRLVLKGETQEVDRVLDAFASRWVECNQNHGFKASGAVHTICYSILLLNTDLHMADIEQKMTRGQFVKNTLPTIRRVVDAELYEGDDNGNWQNTYSRSSTPMDNPMSGGPVSPAYENGTQADRQSVDLSTKRSRNRLSIRPTMTHRTDSDGYPSNPDSGTGDCCTVLVKAPFEGSMKAWEFQVEIVLKEFYNSIKNQRLPLHGTENPTSSSNNLSVGGMLRRTPSVLSKAPSDTTSYRGRTNDFRSAASRWNSKARSRPRLYPSSTIGSSRTSLDDQSVWTPAGSSKWSTYSMGKTGTSMSVDSLGSHFAPADYQQSIGFANALSQAIIREENHTIASYEDFGRTAPLLEDETLELHGSPWAKEGILKHKHHLEAFDKKAKDRNWNEVFAVIEKGYMKLFTFSMNAKSVRSKAKRRPSTGGVVGGGNWTDNAEQLASFLLRQTIASSLPPPGYSKNRPHVWALSLPTGAVHLFQAGTPDIVKEFVTTANYWSARLSKEPLVGGVSNIEYGWGDTVINPALLNRPDSSPVTNGSVSMPRPSIQTSIRNSIDHSTGVVRARLPGDKVTLSDWTPPTQSMTASNLMEVDQLKALTAYVKNVEEDLQRHQELRAPMLIAFSPRHPNAAKAMANFEKKSAYLLRELVKFKTYLDALTLANDTKEKIYKEREKREAENAKREAEAAAAAAAADAAEANDGGAETDKDETSDTSAIPSSVGRLMAAFDASDR